MYKMSLVEMRMLTWTGGNTRKDRIQNELICLKIRVAPIDERIKESCLRWFYHVQQEAINTSMRKRDLIQVEGTKIGDEDPK